MWIPFAGSVLLFLCGSPKRGRVMAIAFSTFSLMMSILLALQFMPSYSANVQFESVGATLSDTVRLGYVVGLDGASMLLFAMTSFIGWIAIITAPTVFSRTNNAFYGLLLILLGASLGVFAAQDLFLFYIFFELALIPMAFLIGIWGEEERTSATYNFVIYTLVGSLLMLVGVLTVGFTSATLIDGVSFSTHFDDLMAAAPLFQDLPVWVFGSFLLAFVIKIPLFPFHSWQANAYAQAPIPAVLFLAPIMVKFGSYALVRFLIPYFPVLFDAVTPWIATLAVVSILYGAMIAITATDIKKILAFSSLSHMGFIVLGLVAWNESSLQGSILQMVNHGLTTAALFLGYGYIMASNPSRHLMDHGGVASTRPVLTTMIVIASMASVGLPGLNGFVGEFLILSGAFDSTQLGSTLYAVLAALAVILAAMYTLRLLKFTLFGSPQHDFQPEDTDRSTLPKGWVLGTFVVIMVWIGFQSPTFTQFSQEWTIILLDHVQGILSTSGLSNVSPETSVPFVL
ncbi:MAG: NADH-quinone oxidoreductase subunit M [Balneolaceae bacterium]|nr:NADH-quinone oxidoreductase subunit M [Balneolaceae bacterium]